jgi:hypothetical protein
VVVNPFHGTVDAADDMISPSNRPPNAKFSTPDSQQYNNVEAQLSDDTESLLSQDSPARAVTVPKTEKSSIAAVTSCVLYSVCSVAMVLTNKGISTAVSPEIRAELPQLTIIMVQCIIAVLFVECSRLAGWIEYPSFNIEHAKPMVPLNLIFIGMLLSGFLSLVFVSVPIVTVFKNLTNLATVTGDWYFFKERSVKLRTLCNLLYLEFVLLEYRCLQLFP